jgi:hypothetical protein
MISETYGLMMGLWVWERGGAQKEVPNTYVQKEEEKVTRIWYPMFETRKEDGQDTRTK